MNANITQTEERKNGISLRIVSFWIIIIAAAIAILMILETYRLANSVERMESAAEEHIELENASLQLMKASDYLTEQVQRYTATGERRFMDNYFTEALQSNNREKAIEKMAESPDSKKALAKLQKAMDASQELMYQEYYAMRLVVEATGETDYPEIIKNTELSKEDALLSPQDKLRQATKLVLSDDYYELKTEIRTGMQESLDELEKQTHLSENSSLEDVREKLNSLRAIIIIQVAAVFVLVWLTSNLGISPVLKAVERIREDSPIPEIGANEFRYLARTYNKMYTVYKNSLEHLNFKASHDELTGAYNRAGYDLLVSSIDLKSTYMLLLDVDNFKEINDSYGHETGDFVLQKIVRILKQNFRSDDYVCRIGGDEFVVFMVHSGKVQQKLIVSKIEEISRELMDTQDHLPPVSVSIGIVHGSDVSNVTEMYEKSDAAMYRSKHSGKNTYSFYTA